ncbi:glycosyltransferase [Microbacterium sediminis]|uniref:Glycosyl transferase n=1 Tax=Microbacterium sediminis TaxID=904291 RepID=A0A1B9NBD5_9MICO|nr:glycosyltransferase [Microbacterium sediminis]OCG73915.1 glycosyl transferase [Microbacterium sediminis]QBR74667.1 glycosyltransferase [Microbacterium sediminis]
MSVSLRVVLDQLVAPTHGDLRAASRDLAHALVASAPLGCRVEAIAPAGAPLEVPGLAGEKRLRGSRGQIAASWQLGIAPGVGGGMIHSPTLLAPLVRHDRVNEGDQTVVTLWDLLAWEAPGEMPRAEAGWHKAMLRRAMRHADAVVVPTHAIADQLAERVDLDERVRVISGAVPEGFSIPSDAEARRRDLGLPGEYVAVAGAPADSDGLAAALRAVSATELDAVVIGAAEGSEPAIADVASSAGLPERRVHVRGALDAGDRAALLGGARAFLAPSARSAWPWRATEAMALGVPLVAVDSRVHHEVVYDGGLIVPAADLGDALRSALEDADRLSVLGCDRARAFTWRGSAEKVWQLHADL